MWRVCRAGRTVVPAVLALAGVLAICGAAIRGPAAPPGPTRAVPGPLSPGPALLDVAAITGRQVLVVGNAVGSLTAGEPGARAGCETIWYDGCMTGGFVLRSTDGGRHWVQTLSLGAGLEGLVAWPGQGALVWGAQSLLFTRGGQHWRRAPLPPGGALVWLDFPSATDGWAETVARCLPFTGSANLLAAPNQEGMTCQEAIFATTDGARQWREIARTGADPIAEAGATRVVGLQGPAVYEGHGRGQLTADLGVLATGNDGATWRWKPIPHGDLAWSVFDQVRDAAGREWALNDLAGPSGYPTRSEIASSTDGGEAWSVVARPADLLGVLSTGPGGRLWAVADSNAKPGIPGATDPWQCPPALPSCGREVVVSRDGGQVWRTVGTPPAGIAAITALEPLTSAVALAVGLGRDGRYQVLRVAAASGRPQWTVVYPTGPLRPAARRLVPPCGAPSLRQKSRKGVSCS